MTANFRSSALLAVLLSPSLYLLLFRLPFFINPFLFPNQILPSDIEDLRCPDPIQVFNLTENFQVLPPSPSPLASSPIYKCDSKVKLSCRKGYTLNIGCPRCQVTNGTTLKCLPDRTWKVDVEIQNLSCQGTFVKNNFEFKKNTRCFTVHDTRKQM